MKMLPILRKRLMGAEKHAVATLVVPRVELRELFDALDAETDGYEYALEETDVVTGVSRIYGIWVEEFQRIQQSAFMHRKHQQIYVDYGGHVWKTYAIARRPKPKGYTIIEEEV